jgi:hypothetical protein
VDAHLRKRETIFKLDFTSSKSKSKIAPVGMHSLFLSFLALSEDGRRMVYIEIGAD